jgi:hypothetical protein
MSISGARNPGIETPYSIESWIQDASIIKAA